MPAIISYVYLLMNVLIMPVARSGEKLNQVAAELQGKIGVAVKTIVLDLTAAPAAKFLFDQFAARKSGSGCSGEQRRV